jgi:hypothetical protein
LLEQTPRAGLKASEHVLVVQAAAASDFQPCPRWSGGGCEERFRVSDCGPRPGGEGFRRGAPPGSGAPPSSPSPSTTQSICQLPGSPTMIFRCGLCCRNRGWVISFRNSEALRGSTLRPKTGSVAVSTGGRCR